MPFLPATDWIYSQTTTQSAWKNKKSTADWKYFDRGTLKTNYVETVPTQQLHDVVAAEPQSLKGEPSHERGNRVTTEESR